ncbi:triose-phosphate isomerase [Acidocella aminolytica]|jgi:triosephosphate isomerase|uniref:Triosephosphate isomerase n=1 Tax=Acidocella aminolytica 101 = DSM 11237 TaxID=1120923 RepID=A0A0D6PFV0_9PROT|nr:triose-phosphate isomerase [Acidocella aminolytica]GAN80231.1 triosephosphate isomerase [Acidocella aminolytica 101 = DSM 11237]GBQ37173.1 triosephosphate isomerase [Acidocella aminolytica 101 = DSM 11237]SHF30234.1 triosephosphate isomerase [Acidocella aminolytica 101 = DSM 11237]
MRQLIAGNWKMFGRLTDVTPFAEAMRAAPAHVDLLVCPPFTLLERFATALEGGQMALGAQNCHANPQGAHTGDIAAPMLVDAGAAYVILGHSERRNDHGENNAVIRAKTESAIAAGLIPIVCVGETEGEREAGEAEHVVRSQLQHSLPPGFAGVVAYEPVWAIGTGRTPTEDDVKSMHAAIRAALAAQLGQDGAKIRILYGGSVKPGNAASLLALPEVGGALVGGASLKAEDFLAIANAAPRG